MQPLIGIAPMGNLWLFILYPQWFFTTTDSVLRFTLWILSNFLNFFLCLLYRIYLFNIHFFFLYLFSRFFGFFCTVIIYFCILFYHYFGEMRIYKISVVINVDLTRFEWFMSTDAIAKILNVQLWLTTIIITNFISMKK